MAGLEESVSAAAGVPVVDSVRAGVTMVAALARSGARTSKHNLYRPVEARSLSELPPGLARIYRRDTPTS
jgi:allantoin racemase